MAIPVNTKLVKADLDYVLNNTKIYGEKRWIDVVHEFIESDLECAEITDYEPIYSTSVVQRLRRVISARGLEDDVFVVHKQKRVFIVKTGSGLNK